MFNLPFNVAKTSCSVSIFTLNTDESSIKKSLYVMVTMGRISYSILSKILIGCHRVIKLQFSRCSSNTLRLKSFYTFFKVAICTNALNFSSLSTLYSSTTFWLMLSHSSFSKVPLPLCHNYQLFF